MTASLGIREALDPGTARGAVPVRSALVGTILAITMVVGTLVFGANLVHLVTTPQLYGQTWQASIDTQFQPIPVSFIRTSLHDRAGVVAWTPGNFGTIDVMDSHIPAIGLSRGGGPLVGPTLVTGRLPTRPDEIALGVSVLRSVNRQVGQDLTVRVNGVPRKMHIVGQAVFPEFDQGSFTSTDLGLGAVVTAEDLVPPSTSLSDTYRFFLVRFAPGPDQAREVRSFGRAAAPYCSGVQQATCFVTSQTPFDIGNYARIEDVPEALALVLAALGVGVLAQLMVVWVQRQRRKIAILKTLGFVRRQVLALVAWEASNLRRALVGHRDPAGDRRRTGRLGPLCGRTGCRVDFSGAKYPHSVVRSRGTSHRHAGCDSPGVVRRPRAAGPGPADRMTPRSVLPRLRLPRPASSDHDRSDSDAHAQTAQAGGRP